jgi:hypothetical protein
MFLSDCRCYLVVESGNFIKNNYVMTKCSIVKHVLLAVEGCH